VSLSTLTARQQLKNRDSKLEKQKRVIKAVTVEVNGSVDVSGREAFIWCQEYGDESSIFQALNLRVQRTAGLPVIVGWSIRPPYQREILELDRDATEFTNFTSDEPFLVNHRVSHQYPSEDNKGADAVLIYQPAIQPLKTTVSSGLIVTVNAIVYENNSGIVKYYSGENVDLTSYVPTTSNKKVKVLLYLNPVNNSFNVKSGVEVSLGATANLPLTPHEAIVSSYTELTYGQTTITDITDIRTLISPRSNGFTSNGNFGSYKPLISNTTGTWLVDTNGEFIVEAI
jgi:hypothetical protein